MCFSCLMSNSFVCVKCPQPKNLRADNGEGWAALSTWWRFYEIYEIIQPETEITQRQISAILSMLSWVSSSQLDNKFNLKRKLGSNVLQFLFELVKTYRINLHALNLSRSSPQQEHDSSKMLIQPLKPIKHISMQSKTGLIYVLVSYHDNSISEFFPAASCMTVGISSSNCQARVQQQDTWNKKKSYSISIVQGSKSLSIRKVPIFTLIRPSRQISVFW